MALPTLRDLRRSKGLLQRELAEEVGIGVGTIGYMEVKRGYSVKENKDKVEKYFGTKIFWPPKQVRTILKGELPTLKEARINAGLTQEELAEKIRVKPHVLSNIENGRYREIWPVRMVTLEKVLKTEIDWKKTQKREKPTERPKSRQLTIEELIKDKVVEEERERTIEELKSLIKEMNEKVRGLEKRLSE